MTSKKPSDVRQQRFLEHVSNLHIDFPGKEIAKKTGYGESTVSEYLNSKKKVSVNFYRTFLEAYSLKDDTFTGTEDEDVEYSSESRKPSGTSVIDKWAEIIALAVQPKKLEKLRQKRLDLLQRIDVLMKELDEDIANEE